MKFFVSYSRSVQDKVREIISSMRDDGDEVWWDQDLRAGQDWWGTILNTIEWCDVCLFMISEKSVQSPYCMDELRYALARNRLVLPYVIDGSVSYTIPPEIMKGRIQYEVYSGTPNHLKQRIRTTCKSITWDHYKDRYASRPPEPNTGTSDLALRTAKAIALAQEGLFDAAIEGFNDVAHNDFATYGEFCHQWIEKINRYKEVANLSAHASMKKLALPKWEAFLKQYADDERFDPLGVQQRFTPNNPLPAVPTAPDETRRVYELIEETRKAHAEGVAFGADPFLYELGGMGEVAVLPVLALLTDPDPLMRTSAINLLGNLGDERAIEPIIGMLQDSDWEVRWAACHMLSRFEDARAIDPLIAHLKDTQAEVREMAASALSVFEDTRAVPALIEALKDENEKVRASAARTLGELKDKRAVEGLTQALKDQDEKARRAAEEALIHLVGHIPLSVQEQQVYDLIGQFRYAKDANVRRVLRQKIIKLGTFSTKPLIMSLQDDDEFIRISFVRILGEIKDLDAVEPLIKALQDNSDEVRYFAVSSLGDLKDPKAVEPLIGVLERGGNEVREITAWVLGNMGDKRAIPVLSQALQDGDEAVRQAARVALEKIRAANPDA